MFAHQLLPLSTWSLGGWTHVVGYLFWKDVLSKETCVSVMLWSWQVPLEVSNTFCNCNLSSTHNTLSSCSKWPSLNVEERGNHRALNHGQLTRFDLRKQFYWFENILDIPYDVVKYTFYTYYDELKISVARNYYAHYT